MFRCDISSLAKVQSTEASNAIEGIVTINTRIRQLVEEKTTPTNRDEQEIAGYSDVLSIIHDSFDAIPIFIHDFLCIHPFNDGTEDAVPFIKYLLGTILAAYKDFADRHHARCEFILISYQAAGSTPVTRTIKSRNIFVFLFFYGQRRIKTSF